MNAMPREPMGPQGTGMPMQGTGLLAGPQGEQEEQPNAPPEEQAQYDAFMANAFTLIYGDKSMPAILERLKGDGDPVDGLARTAALIVERLEASAGQKGKALSSDVLLHGGQAVLEDLAELAGKAKIHDFTPEELETAMYRAMDVYREGKAASGNLDTQGLQQDLSMLVEADKQGRLGQVVPGIEKAAQAMGNAAKQGAA